jgi:hypothetical protein
MIRKWLGTQEILLPKFALKRTRSCGKLESETPVRRSAGC